MQQADEYLDLRLGDFLERLGAGKPPPGGGSAAALTVAIAAGVVAMVARRSEDWEESPGTAAQALALQARAAPLALADAQVWEEALEALAAVREEAATQNGELAQKLDLSATVPVQIAEAAADTAVLAALAAELGDATYRADAASAAVLAAAGARAAAHLVAVNLTVQEGDERLVRARRSVEIAENAATHALDSAR